tara:strand:+ start:10527 stop:10694 length:168 start_codon:yes stop_codon:yes gene_type:complete
MTPTWPTKAERARMKVIGQNGNTGDHYEEMKFEETIRPKDKDITRDTRNEIQIRR